MCVFVSAFKTLNAHLTSLKAIIKCFGVFPLKIFHRVFYPQPQFGLKQLHVASGLSFSRSKLVTKDKVLITLPCWDWWWTPQLDTKRHGWDSPMSSGYWPFSSLSKLMYVDLMLTNAIWWWHLLRFVALWSVLGSEMEPPPTTLRYSKENNN